MGVESSGVSIFECVCGVRREFRRCGRGLSGISVAWRVELDFRRYRVGR